MKQQIRTILEDAATAALAVLGRERAELPEIQLEIPKNPAHGDFSTNIALAFGKPLGVAPRELAAAIVAELANCPLLDGAEVAGPGFINLRVANTALMSVVASVLEAGATYGRSNIGAGEHVQIEFVSANPTGPLHVGHGRGAAYGAVLANILAATGYRVSCEYYVNDAGRQMDILATSVLLRYLELNGAIFEFPANGYKGGYIAGMARQLHAKSAERYACSAEDLLPSVIDHSDAEIVIDSIIAQAKSLLGDAYFEIHRFARDEILEGIKHDLHAFGVDFDNWFAESDLFNDGSIDRAIGSLEQSGLVYTKNAARWFKSTEFGDEKDRVVVRDNGNATYFASDIAYHANKYARGFKRLINIWGADHHGYIQRVKGALEGAGLESGRLEILLVQFAALYRGGEKVAMSTRSGEFVTLAALVEEVGTDAARFFYITRRADQHLDFDLDLAKSQRNENPVYYVQYAHARICKLLRESKEQGYTTDVAAGTVVVERLSAPKEKQLAVQLRRYPEILDNAVRNREPHLITTFLRELAADFHGYYHSERILIDDTAVRDARLSLCLAVKQVLNNGLELLGVSAPEAM